MATTATTTAASAARTTTARRPAPTLPRADLGASGRTYEDDTERSAIGLLLRDPAEVARRCLHEEGLRPLVAASLAAIAVGAATFGGVVGSFRGGEQIAFAASKMPIALLGALVICVPAFLGVAASLGRPWPLRTVIALTLAAAGRAALVLMAFAPVLWLAYDLGVGYHSAALAAAGAYALAGLAALGVLLRGLGPGRHRITTAAVFVGLFLAACGQTGWVLRPYLVRPKTEDAPLFRPIEGGFADALFRSSRSAAGIYDRRSTPRSDVSGSDASRSDASRSVARRSDASRSDANRSDASRSDASRSDVERLDVECPSALEPRGGWPLGSRCRRAASPRAAAELAPERGAPAARSPAADAVGQSVGACCPPADPPNGAGLSDLASRPSVLAARPADLAPGPIGAMEQAAASTAARRDEGSRR